MWKRDSKDKFIGVLSSTQTQDQFRSFKNKTFSSFDNEISQFNKIMMSTANSSLVRPRKTNNSNKKNKPWFDNTCRQLKKQLQNLATKNQPYNSWITS